MKYDLLTVGFPLVEIIRKEKNLSFEAAGEFLGPYPSGDTCIVLDVVARLGKKCCFFGTVGDDPFGRVIMNRLHDDGIDTSYVRILKDDYTAAVFVRYEDNGNREYMDFINHSACARLSPEDIDAAVVAKARWVHFSGEIISNCVDQVRREALLKMLHCIPPQTKVSLDPNFTFDIQNMKEIMQPFVDRADLILPSEGEAKLLLGTKTDEECCRQLAGQGKIIALKQGKKGCDIYCNDTVVHVASFAVAEVDPTGCGDSFCGGFIYGMLNEWPLPKVGRFANAAGALQAMAMGPMEGARYLDEITKFMAERRE